jgi:predicted aldo/keto reductase-like oxidoreductase
MQTRALGTQGLTVSAIGYGAMGTAFAYGPSNDTESIAAIRRAHELGVTHFDTAELYGWGTGEQLLVASSHARASCESVAPLLSASLVSSATMATLASKFSGFHQASCRRKSVAS